LRIGRVPGTRHPAGRPDRWPPDAGKENLDATLSHDQQTARRVRDGNRPRRIARGWHRARRWPAQALVLHRRRPLSDRRDADGLHGHRGADFTFDKIYNLGTGINVADAKPGDRDFNGGRWQVYTVTWAAGVTPVQYTNDQQILAAQAAGLLTINPIPVKEFFCNVAPVPGSPSGR
jgi:hypothetical protein